MKTLFHAYPFRGVDNTAPYCGFDRRLLCFLVLLQGFPTLSYPQDMPPFSNDPTKAQQATPIPGSLPDTRGKGFTLPPVPSPSEMGQSGKTIQIKQIVFPFRREPIHGALSGSHQGCQSGPQAHPMTAASSSPRSPGTSAAGGWRGSSPSWASAPRRARSILAARRITGGS